MKRFLTIAGVTLASFVVLLLLLAGLTQTAFFKDRLRSILVDAASDQINGTLVLGTIDGDFLRGVTVDSVAIYERGELVARTGKVTLAYDVLSFFRGNYHVSHVIVESPDIRFRRSLDGSWNIGRILRPSGDTASAPFTGSVLLPDVEIRNGSVLLVDSTCLADYDSVAPLQVRYRDFSVRDVNLALGASVRGGDLRLQVKQASLASPRCDIVVSNFQGEFEATSQGAAARNVEIRTLHSAVALDATMRGIDLLGGVELAAMRGDSVRLRLSAPSVDLDELRRFLPSLAFLRGEAGMELEADGLFGNVLVRRLHLRTRSSAVNLSGSVRNLHDPANLTLDVLAGDTKVELSDLARLMPEFRIPSFTKTGVATLYLEFNGKPLDFKANASLSGSFGSLSLRGTLDLTRPRPAYAGTFDAERLSLPAVTGDASIDGSLTARGTVEGEGFVPGSMRSTLDLAIDTSRINGITLGASRIRVESDSNLTRVAATLRSNEMAADVRGAVDWAEPGRPSVSGDLDVQNIDLALITGDARLASSLTLRGTLHAVGSDISDASGSLDVRLFPSTLSGHDLPAQEILCTIDQDDPAAKSIHLSSETADVDLTGRFDLGTTPAILARQAALLVGAIASHALPPSDSLSLQADRAAGAVSLTREERSAPIDLRYDVRVKDLGTVSTVVEGRRFDAKASLRGTVRGTADALSFTCDGTVEHFFIGRIDSGMIFNDATIALRADTLAPQGTLERLAGSLELAVGSAFINGRIIDSARVSLRYGNRSGTFAASGTVDSALGLRCEGVASVQPGTYVFDLERLLVGKGAQTWRNDQDVQLRLDHEGVRVLHAVMTHGEERLTVAGLLRHTGEFDMEAGLERYDLRGLNAFIRDLKRAQEGQGFAGNAAAHVRLSGTTLAPRIAFTLRTDSTYFRRTRIGRLDARIDYADQRATLDIVASDTDRDTIPDLAIRGSIPIDLAFAGVERRFPDREQNLTIKSEGFDVSVLDPLIWELDRLSGTLRCDVTIGGTPREPDYRGTIDLAGLRFLFMPNNVAYTAEGSFTPSGDKLVLKDLIVRNVKEDRVPGEARFEGSITIKDYTLHTFDITMYGKLLVMNDATRKIIPTMYGNLFAAPDAKGLNLSGTLARPFLQGNLEVLDANIVFPPTRLYDVAAPVTVASLGYVVVDDTTMKRNVPARFPRGFYAGVDSATATVAARSSADEPALLDRLRYNLVIETKGTTAVKMIFTPNEELYAEMDGKVTAINETGTALIYGEVAVSPRSYYNFLKKFDATGNIKFVGPWDNPELNIVATYEGYRQGRVSESDPASGKDLKTVVTLNIGGTRYEPQLKMSMKVQLAPNGELVDWSTTAGGGDVQSDAISFIVTGKFREDLTSGERAGLAADVGASTTTTVVSGFTSNLLSGILDNFVRREFPFIRSVDVSYRDGSPTVNVGASPGLGYLRVGGRILNNLNNTNVSYQVSMGDIFNSATIRNLFLEIQRRVENDLTGTNREDVTNEARLYYRFSF